MRLALYRGVLYVEAAIKRPIRRKRLTQVEATEYHRLHHKCPPGWHWGGRYCVPADEKLLKAVHKSQPKGATWKNNHHIQLHVLAAKPITKIKQMSTQGINRSYLVTIKDDGRAVFKPASEQDVSPAGARGAGDLWMANQYRREVWTYHISKALGLTIVPPTTYHHDQKRGVGSIQAFAEGAVPFYDADGEDDFDDQIQDKKSPLYRTMQDMMFLDLVLGNQDRHDGNVLFTKGADRKWRTIAIDHGLAGYAPSVGSGTIYQELGIDTLRSDHVAMAKKVVAAGADRYVKNSIAMGLPKQTGLRSFLFLRYVASLPTTKAEIRIDRSYDMRSFNVFVKTLAKKGDRLAKAYWDDEITYRKDEYHPLEEKLGPKAHVPGRGAVPSSGSGSSSSDYWASSPHSSSW